MNQSKTGLIGVLLLLLTALIWGASFVSQSMGMESVGAFTFSGIRMLLGSLALLPLVLIRDKAQTRFLTDEQKKARRVADKKTIVAGIFLGLVFFCASNFQQFAFYPAYHSTPGKIAFITALYIFFVPLFGLPFGKKVPWLTWIAVAIGFVGLFFLCINPADLAGVQTDNMFVLIQSVVHTGDLLAFACSAFFAIHILLIEKFAPDLDGVKLSCIQFAVAGSISLILMFLFESPRWPDIQAATLPILYSGILSCGVAYTLQIVGQKYTEATVASLLMCMESVFAVLASAVLLPNTRLSSREILGCVIMFAAIVLSQFSEKLTGHRAQKDSASSHS